MAAARGARDNNLTVMVAASVRLVRAIQRLTSEEGIFCLVAGRFGKSEQSPPGLYVGSVGGLAPGWVVVES